METLVAVAKSFVTECKKCATERYHRVLAHTSPTSAKIECEVCHAKRTYKIAGAKTTKPKKAAGPTKKALAAETAAKAHVAEYEKLVAESTGPSVAYKISAKFGIQQKLDHPKFGLGVVRLALADRIEVVFPDEVRQLVHGR